MSGTIIKSLVFTALVNIAGCESTTGPEEAPVGFQFGVMRNASEPAFLITASSDSVVVRGYLSTPCAPYNATSRALLHNEVVTLTVVGRATQECGYDIVADVGYEARLRVAPESISRLVVVHEWKDANWPEQTVVDTVFSR